MVLVVRVISGRLENTHTHTKGNGKILSWESFKNVKYVSRRNNSFFNRPKLFLLSPSVHCSTIFFSLQSGKKNNYLEQKFLSDIVFIE